MSPDTKAVPAVLLGDLNMLRCFVRSGVPVILAGSNPDEVTLRSRHAKHRVEIAPLEDTERALCDLAALARRFPSKPVLYYGTDQQLLFLSRHRARLEPLFRTRLPEPELVEKLVDKRLFASLAQELGLPTPVTLCSRDVSGVQQVLERMPLPCVIKPNVHIGWFKHKALQAEGPRKALRADTREALAALYAEVERHTADFVIQQFVPGGENEIYSFHAYMDKGGVALAHFVGKKIRTFPREAGLSTYLELVKEPRVVALGLDVVRKLGLIGPVKIDLKRDPRTGRFYVLELNPRFNLWHYLGMVSGINLPLLAYADLAGVPLSRPRDYVTGVRWLSFGNDFRSFVRSYRPSGELGLMSWLSSLRGPKVYDVFAWDDPLPFLAGLLKYGKAAGKKLWQRAPRLKSPAAVAPEAAAP